MKVVGKMMNSLERMMKDTIETARQIYDKRLFVSLPKITVSRKMFNSHSRPHYEEISDINSLYTRLILNFRLLIFNPLSNYFKGPTARWKQKHSWHVISKQNTRWWVSYTLQRGKRSFLLIIMNLLSLWKLKKTKFLTECIKSSTPLSESLEVKLLQKV